MTIAFKLMKFVHIAFLSSALIFIASSTAFSAEETLEAVESGIVQTHEATESGITPSHDEIMNHGHASDHGHEETGGLPQLDFSSYPTQIFWLVIIFSLMYAVMSMKALPTISSTIDNRKNLIEADLKSAEDMHEKAQNVQGDYETSLQSARDKSATQLHEVENEMKEQLNARLAEFQKRSEESILQAEANINTAKTQALSDINDISANIAAQSVEKILGTPTDKDLALKAIETLSGKAKAA